MILVNARLDRDHFTMACIRLYAALMVNSCLECPVREHCFTRGMDERALTAFSESLLRYSVSGKGTAIFNRGEPMNGYFILCEGSVTLTRVLEKGQEVIIDILDSGSIIAECSMGSDPVHVVSAVSITKSVDVAFLREDKFLSLSSSYPVIGTQVARHLAQKLRRAYRTLAMMKLSVKERVLGLLARMLWRLKKRDPKAILTLPLSSREFAQFVQTTPETLSRTLRSLEREGVIRSGKEGLRVIKEEALYRYIEEECDFFDRERFKRS